jgi:outer membrane receptor for Fe3+-dicitrate
MEDAEFEKYFSVFSSDADEAKLTITPSLRSTLINYAQQTRHGFQVSFTGNYLNIAIASPGLFSWDINSSFLSFAKFEEYFFHLLIAISAVNTIYQSSQKIQNR